MAVKWRDETIANTLCLATAQIGIVAHEIGHAIGFVHEQSRPDRDEYVVVNLENIPDYMEEDFGKYGTSIINNQNVEYDYYSNMHYESTVSDRALYTLYICL